ncbi:putative amidoligase domain-containing protein [Paenibacillus montanisoli]|uniref:Phage phiEco32-like COOH.NH2 ligase-type 2 n=1 Tax=Paenibacillus montanisoli TaxID=2081970 RepID=A0A328UDQ7_9BACL|nr:hypothetical protein [Paenibacillus montanisoli]RAP78196.1 hypothetical protein DL346_07125 [Paenibacillus montanisoli]
MAGMVWLCDGSEVVPFVESVNGMASGVMPEAGDAVIAGRNGLKREWPASVIQPLVINAGAAEFARWPEEEVRRRLARAGVAVWDPAKRGVGRFEASLFQLLPIAVERRRTVGQAELSGAPVTMLQPEDTRYKPLARLAARALYACGLDNGKVELTEDEQGRCFVSRIALPAQSGYLNGIWREAAARLASELRSNIGNRRGEGGGTPILLGADPEFLLLDSGGKVVSAARYLEGGHGAGCDAVVIRGQIKYPIAELRPAPAESPELLARNIRRLLQQAAQRIPAEPPLRWAAGGMPAAGFALGGHLHLSGVALTGRLLRLLDSYVAFPLAMIESPAEQARRPKYGYLGDFRLQPHGGFEYRTLPSWLVSPLAAKASFALALLCARESAALTSCPAAEERFIEAYYSGDRDELRGCLDELAAAMAKTESYGELQSWIEPLLEAIRKRRTWDTASDFRAKWKIAPNC